MNSREKRLLLTSALTPPTQRSADGRKDSPALDRVADRISTSCSGSPSGYLVWGASNGEHELKAAEKLNSEAIELKAQLAGLKDERARWELRVASLKSESIDKDLLDEEAHALHRSRGQGRGGHFHRGGLEGPLSFVPEGAHRPATEDPIEF